MRTSQPVYVKSVAALVRITTMEGSRMLSQRKTNRKTNYGKLQTRVGDVFAQKLMNTWERDKLNLRRPKTFGHRWGR